MKYRDTSTNGKRLSLNMKKTRFLGPTYVLDLHQLEIIGAMKITINGFFKSEFGHL